MQKQALGKKLVAMRFSAATRKALKLLSRRTGKNKTRLVEEAVMSLAILK